MQLAREVLLCVCCVISVNVLNAAFVLRKELNKKPKTCSGDAKIPHHFILKGFVLPNHTQRGVVLLVELKELLEIIVDEDDVHVVSCQKF